MISFLLGCLQLTGFSVFAQQQPNRPNIVFILADDLGYHDLSCTGSTYYETPNIDRIAREGTIFTTGYSASQVCSPSRASLFTGRSPARHGITDYIGARYGTAWRKQQRYSKLLPASYDTALHHAYTTLPEALKAGGYKTFLAGKWHLGNQGSWPEDHGFDVNIGGWGYGSPAGGYFSPWKNPKLENKEPGENLSICLAKETAKFIRENNPNTTGTPFFTFLSFYAVHGPIQTTRDKWKKYRDKAEKRGIADKGFEMAKYLPMRQVQDNPVYAGLVETMDDAVGIVLRALEEAGIADNTIVVFTSDNGGVSAGDAFATANLPLRGGKGYQFEGGIRVPYFIKVPGLANGKQFDTPVINTDFYPTLLELCGLSLKPEEHKDGKSLAPMLQGSEIGQRSLIWHYPHYGNQGGEPSSMIRKGEWKLIHYYEDGRNELYNLQADPGEQQDISARYPNQVKNLWKELQAYLTQTGARYPMSDPEYDAQKEKQYLQQIKDIKMPELEAQRRQFLSTDFDPGDNWWGSEPPTSTKR
ncbi:sulfatase [Parapedobacter sp. SGR-10]|nr:sulfatase [Parapedobacter sp. SGR-10]